MALNPLLDFLRRLRTSDQARKTTDAELLARFIASRNEAAFAALVQRHGPMVLHLCVRVLGNSPDAEDAFQAAYLVLARRASSISRPELLGNWLYGVARRTALRMRADAARRQALGRDGGPVDGSNPVNEASRRELRQVLDHELSRLPDRYRVPLVLHYLEGRTQEEVAHLLGCPRNTIATRLARACERLRGRLARSGVALSGGGLAAVLSEEASATLPTTLLDATVKAATLYAAGGPALVPSTVAVAAEGVIHAMFLSRVKVALAWAVVLGAVATGVGVLGHQSLMQRGSPAVLLAADVKDDAVKNRPKDVIGIGERLFIHLAGNMAPGEPINGVFRVEDSGKVALGPAYGRVKVDGQTLEEAEKTVSQYLLTVLRPPVSVQITRYDPSQRTEDIDALKRRVDKLEKELESLRAVVNNLRKS
jgi:polysaccharide export outer membrane protein